MAPPLIARALRATHPERAAISRREALKASLAAGLAMGLMGPAAFAQRRESRARVVVVGAGFAGLTCADRLHALGHDVTVLEAAPRVGGRVLTFQGDTALAKDRIVEGGGELIGSNHPTWLALAKRFDLSMLDVSDEAGDEPVIVDGVTLMRTQVDALWEAVDHVATRMTTEARPVDAPRPWLTPDAATLDAQSLAQWFAALGLTPVELAVLDAQFRADNGVDCDRQSVLGNLAAIKGGGLERYWTESEVYRCAQGNQALARALAMALGDRVRTMSPVTRIERREGSGGGARVHVGGATLEADAVVLAVPPTVWKDIEIDEALIPARPPQLGMNTKFLSVLRTPVWKARGLSPDSLRTGAINLTWHSTDNQPRVEKGPVVLNAFSGGRDAKLLHDMPVAERAARLAGELEATYPGVRDATIRTRFMDWPGFRYTKAGYSFPAPGELTSGAERLHQAFGPLHVAGEHCSHAFVGYMEGALQSGLEVADRIHAAAS
jgi:monoamine oxidase